MATKRSNAAARLALIALVVACGCDDGVELDDGGAPADGGAPPTGAELTFAVIGDFGDTSDLADGETDTLEVARLIDGWDPDFIVTVGDNDYTDAEFAGTFRGLELGVGQYFHEYIGDYRGSHGPGASENRFFPIPGDHDYGDDCDDPRLSDYLDYFTLPEGPEDETYYRVRRGPVEIFALDSIVDCHQDGGAKLERQRAWLEAAASASDAAFQIVVLHNPPFSSGARHGSAAHVQWPFGDWGVDLVIAGDDHIYERIERDGVVYLVDGLGGVERHPLGAPIEGSQRLYADSFGAVRVDARAERLDVGFYAVDGTRVDAFVIEGEAPAALDPDVPPITEGDWYRPGTETSWQWQLQGTLNTSYDVDVYDVDLFDVDAAAIASLQSGGRRVICYFSAGSYEDFRSDSGELAAEDLGAPLDGFADERWLDIRSSNVHRVMRARLDLAVAKGCDGVEPDNVDGYANANGLGLTARDQLAFNRFIANEAHARGLSVGLKNDLDQIPELVEYFDFALNEQCAELDECAALAPFVAANQAVFVAEYADVFRSDAAARDAMCAAAVAAGRRTLVLALDLDDSYRDSCD